MTDLTLPPVPDGDTKVADIFGSWTSLSLLPMVPSGIGFLSPQRLCRLKSADRAPPHSMLQVKSSASQLFSYGHGSLSLFMHAFGFSIVNSYLILSVGVCVPLGVFIGSFLLLVTPLGDKLVMFREFL